MTVVVSLPNITPPPRYDDEPWTEATIEESANGTSGWATIETVTLDPVDTDPANPDPRSFTTVLGTSAGLYYRVTFADEDGHESPTTPVQQNTTATTAYATVTELAELLMIRSPTAAQTARMERDLLLAAGEINSEIGRVSLAGWELALATAVNLERAIEYWHQAPVAFNVIGLDSETPIRLGSDSWRRHANKLAPLKQGWAIA